MITRRREANDGGRRRTEKPENCGNPLERLGRKGEKGLRECQMKEQTDKILEKGPPSYAEVQEKDLGKAER